MWGGSKQCPNTLGQDGRPPGQLAEPSSPSWAPSLCSVLMGVDAFCDQNKAHAQGAAQLSLVVWRW